MNVKGFAARDPPLRFEVLGMVALIRLVCVFCRLGVESAGDGIILGLGRGVGQSMLRTTASRAGGDRSPGIITRYHLARQYIY